MKTIFIPIITVQYSSLVVAIMGHRYWLYPYTNIKMKMAEIIVLDRGIMKSIKNCQLFTPSSLAASNNSSGIV
jgi:hypothetical protein